MAVIGWTLFLLPVKGLPILLLFIVVIGINNGAGQQANYQLWASEIFPTQYRASAQGLMFFLVRISIGIWSLFVPMIITNFSIGTMARNSSRMCDGQYDHRAALCAEYVWQVA